MSNSITSVQAFVRDNRVKQAGQGTYILNSMVRDETSGKVSETRIVIDEGMIAGMGKTVVYILDVPNRGPQKYRFGALDNHEAKYSYHTRLLTLQRKGDGVSKILVEYRGDFFVETGNNAAGETKTHFREKELYERFCLENNLEKAMSHHQTWLIETCASLCYLYPSLTDNELLILLALKEPPEGTWESFSALLPFDHPNPHSGKEQGDHNFWKDILQND